MTITKPPAKVLGTKIEAAAEVHKDAAEVHGSKIVAAAEVHGSKIVEAAQWLTAGVIIAGGSVSMGTIAAALLLKRKAIR